MSETREWDSWARLGESVAGRGLWRGGIIAVVNIASGRAYFIATQNVGKRLWDQRDRLAKGTHPCPTLQADWHARPEEFEFYLVETVRVPWLLNELKQHWINKFRSEARCYNVKAAVSKKPPRRQASFAVTTGKVVHDAALLGVQHDQERVNQLVAERLAQLERDLAAVPVRSPERMLRDAEALLRRVNRMIDDMSFDADDGGET